jgi:hypothetical protein
VNGSYLKIIKREEVAVVHADYLTNQIITPMLAIARQWMEKIGIQNLIVEVGVIGIEGYRIILQNFGTGPMLHIDRVSIQKKVDKDSLLLLDTELRSLLLAEAGIA